MKNIPTFDEFLIESSITLNEKTSGEIFKPKRGKSYKFNSTKYPELAGEFFDLISTAYQAIGGHSKVKTPDDVFADPDWNWWEGKDLHGTPDFDLIMFGTKTKFGVKFAGVGHDGSRIAKRDYIQSRARDLMKPGFYIEVSGKIAEILMNDYGVPQVINQEDVERVLGKEIDWKGKSPDGPGINGNGWYTRKIAGHPHTKIMLGKPKV